MDYKIVIILLILLLLIILVYREVSCVKEQLSQTNNTMLLQFQEINDRACNKFQANINKCVTQIKDISAGNIQQLRKINNLNQQQIISRRPNYFTETDNSEFKPDIKNESALNPNIFETNEKKDESYFMSDDTKHKKTESHERYAEKSPGDNFVCDDNKCELKIGSPPKQDPPSDPIPLYESHPAVPIIDEDESNYISAEYDDAEEEKVIDTPENGVPNLKPLTLRDSIIDDDDYVTHTPKQKNQINFLKNLVFSDNIYIVDKPKGESEEDSFHVVHSSNKVDMSNSIRDLSNHDNLSKHLTIDLKRCEDYSLTELKNIAKQLSLPTTYKDNSRTRPYNKETLYNNIKSSLDQST